MLEIDNIYADYEPMHIEGLTRGTSLDAYMAILKPNDEDLDVLFPILLTERGYKVVHLALTVREFTTTRLMVELAAHMGLEITGVRFQRPSDGTVKALVDFSNENHHTSLPVFAPDALVIALEELVPIYVLREAVEMQMRHPQPADSVALPLAGMSEELIQQALDDAVGRDEFELASVLRDELRKRKEQK